jgi:hypothetical protein
LPFTFVCSAGKNTHPTLFSITAVKKPALPHSPGFFFLCFLRFLSNRQRCTLTILTTVKDFLIQQGGGADKPFIPLEAAHPDAVRQQV